MPLSAGTKLGSYEILAPIGAGGMGEVYRARDTKLKRDVALKVLPEIFASDPERMARFQREAELLASLNHPNIAHLYGIEERALVMELIEGETLPGPLPIEVALGYARQIAEALEYAHERGVIHRDLKPANVKVTPEGVVKLLDFGLAKAIEDPVAPGDASASPTLTLGATRAGVILGTAAYMSPEQAVGKSADRRSDIFSFGAVLYEMLTGKRAFAGENAGETLASVVKDDPQWDQLPRETPSSIGTLLRRCLAKDRKQRLQAIGEARIVLENPALENPSPPPPPRPRSPWWALAAGLPSVALAMLAFVHFREQPPSAPPPVRFQIQPPDKTAFNIYQTISPDGRKLAFTTTGSGGDQLWVHFLDSGESRVLFSAGVNVGASVFWSPDSRFIAFTSEGKIKRIEATGGPAETVAAFTGGWRAGAWSQDDVIVFGTQTAGLFRVPAAGGATTPLTVLERARGDQMHGGPSFLPDGRHFLYFRAFSAPENDGIYLGSLDAKPAEQSTKRLMASQTLPLYVSSPDPDRGYLLFMREDTLMAQPFDNRRRELIGEPRPVAEHVATNAGVGSTRIYGSFSASSNGVLTLIHGGSSGMSRLTWFDRQGKNLGTAGEPSPYADLALSPDGTRVAVERYDVRNDLWLLEFARSSMTPFTFDPAQDRTPVWSPDGSQIVFASDRKGTFDLWRKASNNAGQEELLLESKEAKYPQDWSRDGHFLLYRVRTSPSNYDFWVLPMDGADKGKPQPYLTTPFYESQGKFSPDGHWVVYMSSDSGKAEVYLQPFPLSAAGGGKLPVSTGGGYQPRWSRNGKEILYLAPNGKMMVVEVSANPVKLGVPKELFDSRILGGPGVTANAWRWDLTPDGRFLINTTIEEAGSPVISVVLNWTALLKK